MDIRTLRTILEDATRNDMENFEIHVAVNGGEEKGIALFPIEKLEFKYNHVEILLEEEDHPELDEIPFDLTDVLDAPSPDDEIDDEE